MASKLSTPLDDPPSASSDDDETEDEQEQEIITQKIIPEASSSSEEEDDEDEESEEETPQPVKNPLEKSKVQNPNSKAVESSSEEESGSESEEGTPSPVKNLIEKPKTLTPKSSSIFEFESDVISPNASDFAIKPSKKIKAFESPTKTATSKRPSSVLDLKDKKKSKVSNGDVDDEKKSVVKRIWSDRDELMLLQGFIDYQTKNGCYPLSDMDGFYQYTMKSIPGNASKSQLYEKVRRLKKKFRVNSEKVSDNGEGTLFFKPHDHKLFELSKKIWGIGGCESVAAAGGSAAKSKTKHSNVKRKIEMKNEDEDEEKMPTTEDFESLYLYWNAGLNAEVSSSLKFPAGVVSLVKENLSLIGEDKAKEMNEKWKALLENEAMLHKKRIALLSNIGDVETTR